MNSGIGTLRCLVIVPALCKAFLSPTRSSFPRSIFMATSSTMSGSSLKDKVFLVTGSTDGIGRHTASRLAENGATVLVHGRREASVRKAVDFVKDKGSAVSKVEGFVADVSSLRGMNQLCDEVLAKTDRLDCLINNAVNVLAPYVITGRLLSLIARAPDGGRVVNVASLSASYSVDFDNLQFEKGGYSDHASYSLSKLLDIMFNAELARRAPDGIICNSLDPGTVNTKMLRAGWGMTGIPIKSANDEFYLATSDGIKGITGKYFVSRRVYNPPPPAKDDTACRRLWAVLEKLSGLSYARSQDSY